MKIVRVVNCIISAFVSSGLRLENVCLVEAVKMENIFQFARIDFLVPADNHIASRFILQNVRNENKKVIANRKVVIKCIINYVNIGKSIKAVDMEKTVDTYIRYNREMLIKIKD